MGKKISELTIASTPYEGEELFAMVEDNATVAAPISSFQSFLSGQDHLASPQKNNRFACTQTFLGTISGATILTIGGGTQNNSSTLGSILGGSDNTNTGNCSVVAGGKSNTASGNNSIAGGGKSNTSSGNCSSVLGGNCNTASGECSTIVGGDTNTASGND